MLAALTSLIVAAPTLVWSSSTNVSGGKRVTLQARGLQPGVHYSVVTRGVCEVKDAPRRRRWRERVHPLGNVPFGTEFRVFIGDAEFPTGVDEARTLFRAASADPEVRLEDRSSPASGRTRCRLTFVGIETVD
ncbi:MAG: hypothetical protein JNJ54_09720 [Myxococcaceae bacterium]|nr:hypothetical protein [Myxococcaceae bacterium]